jgi:ribosomal protein S18 acetylase RimI-like enzyme
MPAADEIEVNLRAASSADKEFLWWLHRATMREYVDQTWGWDDNWQRSRFERNFDPSSIQIIESKQHPIGFLLVQNRTNETFLAAIEIAPEFQNRGIGSQLIAQLISNSDRAHLPVRLSVLKVNPARRLYERLGFRRVEETETHYIMACLPAAPG